VIISVIIPTKNSARTLESCLKSIAEQSYPNCEIVVVDNGSTDQTVEIAKKYTDKVFNAGTERSMQRNYGAAHSSGKYVLVIDSDMSLSSEVAQECVDTLEANPKTLGLVVPEESFGEGWWSQCKRLERSFYEGVHWMEAARCFRKEIFDDVGGYDEENTGTEDYDLPQRIEEKYGDGVIGRVKAPILHDEGKISLLYSCKKKFYYARRLDVYMEKEQNQAKFQKQSSLFARYGLFLGDPVKLMSNPALGVGMLFMKTSEFVSGGLGYLLRKQDSNISSDIYASQDKPENPSGDSEQS